MQADSQATVLLVCAAYNRKWLFVVENKWQTSCLSLDMTTRFHFIRSQCSLTLTSVSFRNTITHIHEKQNIYSHHFHPFHATKPSFFFNLRSGRLPRLQVRPLRARQRGASLPVSESPGEPTLHEGDPEGEGAALGGADTQTFNRRDFLQTHVLKSKKKF